LVAISELLTASVLIKLGVAIDGDTVILGTPILGMAAADVEITHSKMVNRDI
jgi:hypothetical protein